MKRLRAVAAFWLVACLAVAATAQPIPSFEAAQQHAQAGEWEQAAEVAAALVEQGASNRQAQMLLGAALSRLERYAEAAALYEQLAPSSPPFVPLLAGLRHAQAGDLDAAFDWLGRAADRGYVNLQQVQTDPALGALRADARYPALADRLDRAARPCAYSERHRAFDFWIGEWDVTNAGGQLVGTNSIQPAEGECVLVERWSGGSGSTGTSLNYYDPAKDRWVQQWVAPAGTLIHLEGDLDDEGAMVLVGTITTVSGDVSPFRGTWTPLPDGRVRQLFEQSNDDGTTWTPWFDGFYAPRESGG